MADNKRAQIQGTMKFALLAALGVLMLASTGKLTAQSFAITDELTETVGSTSIITGSGDKNNTTTWATGVVGTFELNGGDYYMRVNATNPTGSLTADTDSLMVARTVNSQGLTDQGTLSVYVNTAPTSGVWSLDLEFEFFTDINFTVAADVNLLLTSLDIDFSQLYYTSSTDFTGVTLYPDTDITTPTAVSGYNGYTASGDSQFNDATHAVSSSGEGNSFNIRISHTGVALYMFEFRDPPSVVPEPSTALLAFGGVAVLALRRRRTRLS